MGVKENSVKLYITLYTCFTVFTTQDLAFLESALGLQAIIELPIRGIIRYLSL